MKIINQSFTNYISKKLSRNNKTNKIHFFINSTSHSLFSSSEFAYQVLERSQNNKNINKTKSNGKKTELTNNLILTSELIDKKLYSEEYKGYYSNINTSPINKTKKTFDFKNVNSIGQYQEELNNIYPDSSYATASEILYPYYGFTVANYILRKYNQKNTHKKKYLDLVEIGCGMGGLASSILSYLKRFDVKVYKETKYTSFETNKHFCDYTRDQLHKDNPLIKNDINIINDSLFNINATNLNDKDKNDYKASTFILMFNFFNSLPHNRFYIPNKSNFEKRCEAYITKAKNEIEVKGFNIIKEESFKYIKQLEEIVNKYVENQDIIMKKEVDKTNDYGISIENYRNTLLEFYSYCSNLYLYLKETPNIISISHVDLETKEEVFVDMKDYIKLKEENNEIDDVLDIIESIGINFYPSNLFSGNILKHEKSDYNEDWTISLIKKYHNFKGRHYLWLPSNFKLAIKTLNNNYPNADIVINDFDFLVNFYIKGFEGINRPSIYYIKEGTNKFEDVMNFKELLSSKEIKEFVNIYFPINFDFLRKQYFLITGEVLQMQKQRKFMSTNFLQQANLSTGFNPLIETHSNSTFLLTTSQ